MKHAGAKAVYVILSRGEDARAFGALCCIAYIVPCRGKGSLCLHYHTGVETSEISVHDIIQPELHYTGVKTCVLSVHGTVQPRQRQFALYHAGGKTCDIWVHDVIQPGLHHTACNASYRSGDVRAFYARYHTAWTVPCRGKGGVAHAVADVHAGAGATEQRW